MHHHQWTNHHNRHTTRCVLINHHDWRSMAYELRTGDHVTAMAHEPTEADYRAHLREAGIDPHSLALPAQMAKPHTTDARQCGSCRKFFPRAKLVKPKRGNLICGRCAEKKGRHENRS